MYLYLKRSIRTRDLFWRALHKTAKWQRKPKLTSDEECLEVARQIQSRSERTLEPFLNAEFQAPLKKDIFLYRHSPPMLRLLFGVLFQILYLIQTTFGLENKSVRHISSVHFRASRTGMCFASGTPSALEKGIRFARRMKTLARPSPSTTRASGSMARYARKW